MGFSMELVKAKRRINELETQVAELQKQLTPPPPPVVRAEISFADLHNLLCEKCPGAQLYISDNIQYLCDIEDINAFLAQDETNRIEYKSEEMDCDDFAYRLQGQFSTPDWAKIAVGIIWSDKHALNAFIDANRDFWFIEPQSDKVQSNLEEWQGSRIQVVMI